MSVLLSLRPLAGIAALFGASMLALALLVANDVDFAIVPPPETEAESLVRALKARRFGAVKGELTEGLKKEVEDEQLEKLLEAVQAVHKGISDAYGESANKEGDRATAKVTVKLEDKTEDTLELPLQREHGLWRVSSIEPLGRLAR